MFLVSEIICGTVSDKHIISDMRATCKCGCGLPVNIAKFNRPDYGWIKGKPVKYLRGHHLRIPILDWPDQLCKCGCGKKTPKAKRNHKIRGWIKGKPLEFIHGHNGKGELNGHYKGGRFINNYGYVMVLDPKHPMAQSNGYVMEHVKVVCERECRTLGKREVVHHKNGIRADNRPDNLEIFPSQATHMKIHAAETALRECGNSTWRKCCYCHKYDDVCRMIYSNGRRSYHHSECRNKYRRERYALTGKT